MTLNKDEVNGKVSAFISLCVAISTEGYNNVNSYKVVYEKLRNDVLSLSETINLPFWILYAVDPAALISHVKITVEGGNGAWERRREYFKKQCDLMSNSIESFQDETTVNSFSKGNQSIKPLVENISNVVENNIGSGFTRSYNSPKNSPMFPQKKKKIFIVHGHDNILKHEVARLVDNEGFESIILHENANSGMTIIDKLEHYIRDVSYAIVLYTPCDEGKSKEQANFSSRARQNVVFEHGLLIGRLGRDKVAAIKEPSVEIPGDIQGVLYIDQSTDWKYQLMTELKQVG